VAQRHLIIIAADRAGERTLLDHLSDAGALYEIQVDRRRSERRQRRQSFVSPEERRRADRRQRDVRAELRRVGYAIIPAHRRSGELDSA
jgi:hypothetical protein